MHPLPAGKGQGSPRPPLTGDGGAVLVIAVLMLILLALMGSAAVTTSCIEMHVAANERTYRHNLYRAEGAAMLGGQWLENTIDNTIPGDGSLSRFATADPAHPDPFHAANWDPDRIVTALDSQSSFTVVHSGEPPAGGSLDMEGTRLHHFDIYGRSDLNRGTVIVQIGWRKRY